MSDDFGLGLPASGSDLSTWRFFVFRQFGGDSHAYAYLDRLCSEHGRDWEIEQEPWLFLDHVARLDHTAAHAAWQRS